MTIHILHHGLTLCGVATRWPDVVPDGHHWVRLADAIQATCPACCMTFRMNATIVALKIALQQAADLLRRAVYDDVTPGDLEDTRSRAKHALSHYDELAKVEWEAMPVELTGPRGDA